MNNVCFYVLSLNVRGIRDLNKRKSIFTWTRNQKADIIFLQETFSTPDVFDSWKFQWSGDLYYSHRSNHSKGVLVLIRETLQLELKSVKKDSHGRFVIVEALVQDSPVLLINIYAPNNTVPTMLLTTKASGLLNLRATMTRTTSSSWEAILMCH